MLEDFFSCISCKYNIKFLIILGRVKIFQIFLEDMYQVRLMIDWNPEAKALYYNVSLLLYVIPAIYSTLHVRVHCVECVYACVRALLSSAHRCRFHSALV